MRITDPPSPSLTASKSANTTEQVESTLTSVGKAVSAAMQDARIRRELRDAMRDSPWDEHQLIFQEYIDTPAGQRLLVAAAAAAGVTPGELRDSITLLPELDLYVPLRDQRRTWRATPNVALAVSLNPEAGQIYLFGSDGRPLPLPAKWSGFHSAVLVLQPSEPKGVRRNPQPLGVGEVIQSEDDGESAPSFQWIEPDGTVITPDLDRVLAGEDPRFRVLTRATTTSADEYTRIDCVTIRFRDGGELAGNVELVLKAEFFDPDGRSNGTGVYTDYGFLEPAYGAEITQCPEAPLIHRVIPEGGPARIRVSVWEDDCDCFGNGDDYYGSRDFTVADRNQRRTVYNGSDGASDLELDWTPRPASVLSGASMTPLNLLKNSASTVTARALDQYGYGIPGYSVSQWWVDNPSLVSVAGTGALTAQVQSYYTPGTTLLHASIGGFTATEIVTVEELEACADPRQIICD
jgi:hypothetical protein